MKTIGTLTAALALLVSAGAANAADVYSNGGGLKDGGVIAGQAYNWSGFYIGGYLGMHANNTTIDIPSGPASFDGIGSQGLMGGGELGLDFQAGNFVFGVFGRGDFPTAETVLKVGPYEIKDTMQYMWTAGGRGGVLVGNTKSTLIYVDVGYSQVQYDLTAPGGFSWSRTPGGITAGGGIETQLGGGFTGKLAWDWTGLEAVDLPPSIVGRSAASVTTDIQRVQVGLDYKLNVGRLPLN